MVAIERGQQVELPSLAIGREAAVDVLDQFFDGDVLGVDVSALMNGRQKRRLPVLRPWIGRPPGHRATKPAGFDFRCRGRR